VIKYSIDRKVVVNSMEKVVKNTLEMYSKPFVKTVQEIYNISENMEINQMSTRGSF